MWAQLDGILRQAGGRVGEQIAAALPSVLAALVLLTLTAILAVAARLLLIRGLEGIDFDHRAERLGLVPPPNWPPGSKPTMVVARAVQWTIVILGVLLSLTALDAALPARLALSIFEYLPDLLAAFLIVIVGSVVARFLSQSVLIGAVNMQIRSARLLSMAVKWMVLLITVAMALDHLRIGRNILILAFGILFGGIVLAVSLACGLGARDAVARAIDRQLASRVGHDDELDHV
jgi:hypothetical protein